MANFTYNVFKLDSLTGRYNPLSRTVKVALVQDSYSPDKTHTTYSGDIAAPGHEPAGGNYSAGGKTLTSKTATLPAGEDLAQLDSSTNPVWNSSTITASGAVVYEDSESRLIAYIDFGENKSSDNGTFQITWSSQGIVRLGEV